MTGVVSSPDFVGKVGCRNSTLPAAPKSAGVVALLTEAVCVMPWLAPQRLMNRLLPFADGGDGVAGAEDRSAFVAAEDLAEDPFHLRDLPGDADRRRPHAPAYL